MSNSSTRRPAVRQRLLVALQVMLMVASLLAVAPVAAAKPDPSADPSATPSTEPSASPEPTPAPTAEPTPEPTAEPTPQRADRRTDRGAGSDRRAHGRADVEPSPDATPEPTATPARSTTSSASHPEHPPRPPAPSLLPGRTSPARSPPRIGHLRPGRLDAWSPTSGPTATSAASTSTASATAEADPMIRYAGPVVAAEDRLEQRLRDRRLRGLARSSRSSTPASTARIPIWPVSSSPGTQILDGAPARPTRTATAPPWPASSRPDRQRAGHRRHRLRGRQGHARHRPRRGRPRPGQRHHPGVVWAVDHGADVINMSFSNPGYSAALQAAIDYAWAHNVVVVAATGNDGSSPPRSRPATAASSASRIRTERRAGTRRPTTAPTRSLAPPGRGS